MPQIPPVPAGWAVVCHHPREQKQEVHVGFPGVKEPPAPEAAFWTGPFSVTLLHWQSIPRKELIMSSLLVSCCLTVLFFFRFLQLVDRYTSSPSLSRGIYDFAEMGWGEGRSCTTRAVSPGCISPVTAHMSLPCCLPTCTGLIFSPLAQGVSLYNSLFSSNLVKERQQASELGLNGA